MAESRASTGAERARIAELVDKVERSIINSDKRGVATAVEALKNDLSDPSTCVVAIEGGAVQALLTTLSLSHDSQMVETILVSLVNMGKRPNLGNNNAVPIALLLRAEGISRVVRSAEEFKQNTKIRELSLRILCNCASEEPGTRMITYTKAFSLIMELIKKYSQEKTTILLGLTCLSSCVILNVTARQAIMSADSSNIPALIAVGRMYKQDPEILEQVLTTLCMLSTTHMGAEALLAVATLPNTSYPADVQLCSVEIGNLAIEALTIFAVRSYQKSVDDTRALAGGTSFDSPINLLKNGISKLTSPSATPAAISVVTHVERRCTAWALMLLHNLAMETRDANVRRDILSALQQSLSEQARELHKRVLEKVRAMTIQTSENAQDEAYETLEPSEFVELAATKSDDDLNESIGLPLILNWWYLASKGDESAKPRKIFESAGQLIANELKSGSSAPLPLSPGSSKVISLILGMLSHPYSREKLVPEDFEFVSTKILTFIRAADPPEYFKAIAKAMESAIGNGEVRLSMVPHRSLPLLVTLYVAPNPTSIPSPANTPVKGRPTGSAASGMALGGSAKNTPGSAPRTTERSTLNSGEGTRPNLLTLNREVVPDSPIDFSLFDWRTAPKELCKQITLKMEHLYHVVNPCVISSVQSVDENIERFCRFHTTLVNFFKQEILARQDAIERAALIECIISVAFVAAQAKLSNLDLTIACLEALEAKSIKRLEITWKNVHPDLMRVLNELKQVSRFEDLNNTSNDSGPPPPLLRGPAIPYMNGCLDALRIIEGNINNNSLLPRRTIIEMRYRCLRDWLPNLSRGGDWHAFSHLFAPIPTVQMALAKLSKLPLSDPTDGDGQLSKQSDGQDDDDFIQFSLALEPVWAVEKAEAEESLMLQTRLTRFVEEKYAGDLRRWNRISEHLSEQLGLESKLMIKDLLLRDELAVIDRKKAETYARSIIERVLVRPQLMRMLEVASSSVIEQETTLVSKCDALNSIGFSKTCDIIGLPPNLRLHWRGPVVLMKNWSAGFLDLLPHQILSLVLQIKTAIFDEAKDNGLRDMSADDLLPVLALIVIQAAPQTICSSCAMLNSFYGDELASGEAAYYLITIQSAIQLIVQLKL